MKEGVVRPLAICVFRKGDQILVTEDFDRVKNEVFYRPLGGTIEFGEYGHEAATREIREELGVDVMNVRYLGTLENIFTYEGKRGHEIVLVYEGDFTDKSLYETELIKGHEGDDTLRAVWKPISYFQKGMAPLYPEGLLTLLNPSTS